MAKAPKKSAVPKPTSPTKTTRKVSGGQAKVAATAERRVPKVAIVVLVIVGALSQLGIVGVIIGSSYLRKHPETVEQVGEILQQINDYPEAYKAAGLPQYPGGDITHFGDREASPQDGIFIFVTTGDSLEKVATDFDAQMKAKGWTLKNDNATTSEVLISRTYTKDGQEYHLSVNRDQETGRTNVTINWTQTGS